MTLETTEVLTETQMWNAIVRHFGLALPLPAGHAVLGHAEPPGSGVPQATVSLGPDLALSLALDSFPFGRLTGVELTLDEVVALPTALAEGLVLGAVDALRAALPPHLAGQVTLPAQLGSADHDIWLAAEIDLGSGALARCRIGGRRQDFVQVLARLFPGAAGRLPPLPTSLLEGLSIAVALSAGEKALSVATIAALEPGDVVLAEIRPDLRSFHIGHNQVLISTATITEEGQTAPSGWTVKEIRMTGDQSDAGSDAISLDDVPLTLRFVTEDRRLSLAELQCLAAGALLPFDVSQLAAGVPVKIQANGMTVGEGHIVRLDDSFAVRIARMAPKGT